MESRDISMLEKKKKLKFKGVVSEEGKILNDKLKGTEKMQNFQCYKFLIAEKRRTVGCEQ